jgi:pyruvate/2-oxoglutarate dehydrogenase complex dihydrolipoamide acyltransferase (E2) component
VDFRLPRLADSQEEGVITRWLKQPGESVEAGEPLLEVETEKVNSELEAPIAGVLAEIRAPAGSRVPVGEVIARIDPVEEKDG